MQNYTISIRISSSRITTFMCPSASAQRRHGDSFSSHISSQDTLSSGHQNSWEAETLRFGQFPFHPYMPDRIMHFQKIYFEALHCFWDVILINAPSPRVFLFTEILFKANHTINPCFILLSDLNFYSDHLILHYALCILHYLLLYHIILWFASPGVQKSRYIYQQHSCPSCRQYSRRRCAPGPRRTAEAENPPA